MIILCGSDSPLELKCEPVELFMRFYGIPNYFLLQEKKNFKNPHFVDIEIFITLSMCPFPHSIPERLNGQCIGNNATKLFTVTFIFNISK